jgi:anti-sigma regulatory factor (Ser/Thr protein kinase)
MQLPESHGAFDLARAVGGPVSTIIPLGDSSRVGEVRRVAARLASLTRLEETAAGRLAVVATELGNNLVRYAREGSMAMRVLQSHDGHGDGVEIIALDRGPGIADLTHALRDGYSTGGTPGHGLGAVSRMADQFDIHSVRERGTTVVARVWAEAARAWSDGEGSRLDLGLICTAIDGGAISGDGWATRTERGTTTAFLVDGLGHGPEAAAAADAALKLFDAQRALEPAALLRAAHGALRATRGAASAMAVLDAVAVRFAGVGNISATLVRADGSAKTMVSSNGIVGHNVHKTQDFTYDWTPDAMLVMHTDGLSAKWRMEQYPGLASRHPSLIAATLYRDFARPRDDATVLVLKKAAPRGRAP